jgi:UDP-glucose 4-epimerase
VFPEWHNKRSMLYIDNLAEFVLQAMECELEGTFYPQNRELADTVEIIRFFAKDAGHRVWITKLLNPIVWLGSFVLQPINKMFATYYYDQQMSKMEFDYQLVSFEESLHRIADSLK